MNADGLVAEYAKLTGIPEKTMGKMRSVQYMKTDAEVATIALHHRIFKLLEWDKLGRCRVCDGQMCKGHNPGCDLDRAIKDTAP